MIGSTLVGLAVALVATWLALGVLAFAVRSPGRSLGETMRVFPDSLRLAAALYRDRTLPGSVRWRLRVALIYNVQPINLIPDVVPVIGFADNVAVLAWALRGAVRAAGEDAVERHWRGSSASLEAVYRALRLQGAHAGRRLLIEEES